MAPNPRVADAFRAMKNLGITANVVKPVLKNLVKVYDNNWDFIEEENYRALVDAIFEKEEGQVAQPRKKNPDVDAQLAEIKKKRRNEDVQVAETKKKHGNNQEDVDEEAEVHGEPDRPLKRLRKKYQENPVASSSLALLKPKDEPVTDNLLPLEASIANINPGALCAEQSLGRNDLTRDAEVPETLPSHPVNVKERSSGAPSLSERRTNSEFANIADESSINLELASTASGEVKISMSCIAPVPSLDELLKRTDYQFLQSYKFLDSSFSVRQILNKLCECALELGTSSSKESQKEKHVTLANDSSSKSTPGDVEAVTKVPPTPKRLFHTQDAAEVEGSGILCLLPASNGMGHSTHSANDFTRKDCGVGKDNEQNGMENVNSHNLMVVEHLALMPLETSSPIYVIDDISKALETVAISLVNEVNNELPSVFRYIPGNIRFEKADVSFSLSRIGESCSTCSGDCVSNPCACTHATGGVVYTLEGLIKEDFLEECIEMNRDSPKESLSYCEDCPLERSKQEDAKEGCKGHLVRKLIKECWLKCGCNGRCGNRVVQRGIKRKLQVFMTPNGKGWGLRTLEDLPKGTFVCEFAGEILTTKELYTRVSLSSNTEKHEFPVCLDADWTGKVMKEEQALCLDAVYYGNVARFINHRCFDANLVGIPVEVETPQHHYYRFALFTTRKVDAFEELTRDYGIDFDDNGNEFKTFECLCESEFCRNLRRMTRSRSTKRRG